MNQQLTDVLRQTDSLDGELVDLGAALAYAARVAATKELRMSADGACRFLHELLLGVCGQDDLAGRAARQALACAGLAASEGRSALSVVGAAIEAAGS